MVNWIRNLGTAGVALIVLLAVAPVHAGKPVVRTQDDLPRYSYKIAQKPSELLTDGDAFAQYTAKYRVNVRDMLDNYIIEDRQILRDLYMALARLDALDGSYAPIEGHFARIRDLEDKPAGKLTSGLLLLPLATAKLAHPGADVETVGKAAQALLAENLKTMPWDIVQDNIERTKSRLEIFSTNVLVGIAKAELDPVVEKNGALSHDNMTQFVGLRWSISELIPHKEYLLAAITDYVNANKEQPKAEIWSARNVDLTERSGLTPVTIAIWDTGIDVAIFRKTKQLFVNPGERQDNSDSDKNGYIDDVHGIAYTLKAQKTSGLLLPVPKDKAPRLDKIRDDLKGFSDLQANIDSPEASALKRRLAALAPEETKSFIEDLNFYSNYAHGTHVAGIAARGNPAIRLLTARLTPPYTVIPPPYLEEDARAEARMFQEVADYFRSYGVRVVNMSWIYSPRDVEQALEANGIESDPRKRKERAKAIFDIFRRGFIKAVVSAPEILFVAAAGNSDSDVAFAESVPAGVSMPNLVAVGAVDQAGDETFFTSYGKTVRFHASGFEVESFVPGGTRMKLSGTSLSSPNVVNLAAKLLAIDPSLTVQDVIGLISEGVDVSEDGRRKLINPRKSIDLLTKR